MKKIFTKSIITTLVCSMLVVTAAGCSNGTNAESSSSTPTETQATQVQTTAPEGVNLMLCMHRWKIRQTHLPDIGE